MRTAIIWFRNDLRLHDNEALKDALALADEIIPVYIFDERTFKGKTKHGFHKTGKFRAQFIIQSVKNLRKNLQKLGTDLYVAVGKPEDIISQKAREWKTHWVYCNRERTHEEVEVQDSLEKHLWETGQEIKYYRGKMLYYTADLPFPVSHCPDNFTSFRKEVENFITIRNPLNKPEKNIVKFQSIDDWGVMPTLNDFGLDEFELGKGVRFEGGEDEALSQLRYYLWESDHISNYKETRNGLLGRDYSSKFSPWLSQGCLSPKTIYHEVKAYESERGANDSTYWLIYELLWRDFFRLMGKKHGNRIFQKHGFREPIALENQENNLHLQSWINGETGIPFIDANMKELNQTGFMSNRGRQNVASFLIKDLKVNWVKGAEYFESMLLDYDPCSNYGNWNYIAGVGSDLRHDRYFNILAQAKKYDPKGEYVKYWIPNLEKLPSEWVHQPDALTSDQKIEYDFELDRDYPQSIFDSQKWI